MKQYDEMTEDEKNKLNDLEITTAEEIMENYNKLMKNYNSLQQENTNLKMQIDEVKEYIKTLSTKEDLTNAGLTKEFADGCIFGYECIKDDVGFILSKLKEVKK